MNTQKTQITPCRDTKRNWTGYRAHKWADNGAYSTITGTFEGCSVWLEQTKRKNTMKEFEVIFIAFIAAAAGFGVMYIFPGVS